jgi:hypothetical protein
MLTPADRELADVGYLGFGLFALKLPVSSAKVG